MVQMEKYLKLFIEEAEDYLKLMDKCVHELENEPNNESSLYQLYRSAHSIKGMAATMGYEGIRDISHAMEDLFDMLVKKKMEFSKGLINVIYEGIDNIKNAIENIKAKKEVMEFSGYIKKIQDIKEKGIVVEEMEVSGGAIAYESQDDLSDKNIKNYIIEVGLSSESAFPAARAMVIYNKLNSMGKINSFEPPLDEIMKGKPCYSIIVDYNTNIGKEEIESYLKDISEVQKVNIATLKKKEEIVIEESAPPTEMATFKIDAFMLDSIYNAVTELYILNEEFQEYKNQLTADLIKVSTDYNFIIKKLYNDISKIRLLPLSTIMDSLPRIIREIAKEQNKKVNFFTKGQEILVDKGILEHLIDPFVHIVRNAVDHGIENPEERLKLGKKEVGTISIEAESESGFLKIIFADDGRGINLDKIKDVALQKGVLPEQKIMQMKDEEILSLITLPGFSTAPTVSAISGRGFGMDIVKARVESIGGRIKIESKLQKGTKIILYVPLEISIIDSFIIRVSDNYFAIPMSYISRSNFLMKEDIQYIQNEAFTISELGKIQLTFLSDLLGLERSNDSDNYYVMIMDVGNVKRGVIVDEILEHKKVIVKPLKSPLELLPYYQGIAILSKGKLLPVVDVNKLMIY